MASWHRLAFSTPLRFGFGTAAGHARCRAGILKTRQYVERPPVQSKVKAVVNEHAGLAAKQMIAVTSVNSHVPVRAHMDMGSVSP